MEITTLLNIYNDYLKRINDLWRSFDLDTKQKRIEELEMIDATK